MRKSKSLSIIMATMLATQGGGGSAVFAMKGKIQDNLLKTLFFRPNLMSTLKGFLAEASCSLPDYYRTPAFSNYLKKNDLKGFNLPNKSQNIFRFSLVQEKKSVQENQEYIKKIIEEDNLDLLHKEFEKYKDISVIDCFFEHENVRIPLLHYCVMKGAIKCFKFLVLNNVDPCKVLTESFGDVMARNSFKYCDCISMAVCFGNWEMVKILEEKGIGKVNNPGVWEAAALAHRNKLLKQLISNKDNIGNFQECMRRAMYGAVKGNNIKGLAILISNVDNTDSNYISILTSSLHLAVEANSFQVAEMLISKGANVNDMNIKGESPLHMAVRNDAYDLVELLISKGANVGANNLDHETPLHLVRSVKIAELLISKGADINARDLSGRVPLHLARSNEIAELLVSKGAERRQPFASSTASGKFLLGAGNSFRSWQKVKK